MWIDLELEYETVETGKKGTHCIRVRYVQLRYPYVQCYITTCIIEYVVMNVYIRITPGVHNIFMYLRT